MKWLLRLQIIFILTHALPLLVLLALLANFGVNQFTVWVSVAAISVSILLALALYRDVTKPLLEFYGQIKQTAEGNLGSAPMINLPGIYGKMLKQLKAIAGKLDEFVSRSQTETDVITAEANRLRMILNSINDGVFALDMNKQVVLFNKAATQISGLSIKEVAGKHINDVMPLMKSKKLVLSEWIDKCANTTTAQQDWQNVLFKNKDGDDLHLDLEALYTGTDPNGVRTLVTFHNRTEEQQIEDMKVDFVALAAHELRTPVTIIKGYVEILQSEAASDLKPEHQEFIRKLEVSAGQLAGSINNILHVSHIEHGELNLRLEYADWSEIVLTVVEEMNVKAKLQDKLIKTDIPDDLPAVSVDRVSITGVLNNLIDNAIKYSDSGQEVLVKVGVDKSGNMINTDIIDNGVGIPANAIGKLFTKFYRSHRTRNSYRGTGLGLYMSKAIVEAHNGRIHVDSKEGQGSTFGFELPTVENKDIEQDNNNITRGVHGWIKNHSHYRG